MSVLDKLATQTVVKSTSGPTRYTESEPAVFDAVTNRTYQLVTRDSDSVPHCASRAGKQNAMLAQLNQSRRLSWERGQLNALIADKATSADARKVAQVKVDAVAAEIKATPRVDCERCDHTACMFYAYENSAAD